MYSKCYGFNLKQVFYGLLKQDGVGITWNIPPSLPNEPHVDLMASPTVKITDRVPKEARIGQPDLRDFSLQLVM